MKALVKKIKITMIIIIIVLIAVGCNHVQVPDDQLSENGGDNNEQNLMEENNNKQDKNTDVREKSGVEILSEIFPDQIGFTWMYYGYAEYGHIMSIVGIKTDIDFYNISIKGYMNDGVEDPDPHGNRTFTIEYNFNNSEIKEYIVNNEDNSNNINSIIPNKTILKLPLKEGNSWEDVFSYNGKNYTALSVLEEIRTNDEELKKEYVVRTTVNDIEGFPDNTYVEQSVYREGTGLVGFIKTGLYYESYMPLTEDEPFNFGYGLSRTEVIPVGSVFTFN